MSAFAGVETEKETAMVNAIKIRAFLMKTERNVITFYLLRLNNSLITNVYWAK
jgi:hypothetical protein